MEALLIFCSAPLLRAPIDITVVIHGQLTRCARGAGLPFVFLPRTAPEVQSAAEAMDDDGGRTD